MNSSSHPQPGYAASPASSNAQTTVSEDYRVRTRTGQIVFTSPDLDIARKWLFARRDRLPKAVVTRFTRTDTEEAVYRPRTLEVVK